MKILRNFPLDKEISVLSTLPAFFAKIQESFYRQVRIVHEIVDTKNR